MSILLLSLCMWPVAPDAAAGAQRYEYVQIHMGMPVRMALYAGGEATARSAAAAGFARIAQLDAMMSDYRAESDVRRLDGTTGWVRVSAELFAVIACARDLARASRGAFDPTVGPLVTLWREARATRRLPARPSIQAARRLVGWQSLQLDEARSAVRFTRPGMRLDLGGIAKGFIAQQALDALRDAGIPSALIEAGGDIVVSGAPPGRPGWHIDAPGAAAALASRAARLTNSALATSGPTVQSVELEGTRYSHVVDPRTGLGITNDRLAYVIARDAMIADALATTLTIVTADERRTLLQHFPGVVISIVEE